MHFLCQNLNRFDVHDALRDNFDCAAKTALERLGQGRF
jgi:hypothetical protein